MLLNSRGLRAPLDEPGNLTADEHCDKGASRVVGSEPEESHRVTGMRFSMTVVQHQSQLFWGKKKIYFSLIELK